MSGRRDQLVAESMTMQVPEIGATGSLDRTARISGTDTRPAIDRDWVRRGTSAA